MADIFELVDRLQRVQVEDRDCAFAAVAGETATVVGIERNAVHPQRVRNVAQYLAAVGINDDHVRSARNEQVPRAGIERQIVPATLPTQFEGIDDVQARILREQRSGSEKEQQSDPISFHVHDLNVSFPPATS